MDVVLQVCLDHAHVDVEGDEVAIELVRGVIEQLVVLPSEVLNVLLERVDNRRDVLKFVLVQSSELLNGAKEFL